MGVGVRVGPRWRGERLSRAGHPRESGRPRRLVIIVVVLFGAVVLVGSGLFFHLYLFILYPCFEGEEVSFPSSFFLLRLCFSSSSSSAFTESSWGGGGGGVQGSELEEDCDRSEKNGESFRVESKR